MSWHFSQGLIKVFIKYIIIILLSQPYNSYFCNEKPTACRGLYKIFKIIVAVEVRQAAPYFRISRGLRPHTEVSGCRT